MRLGLALLAALVIATIVPGRAVAHPRLVDTSPPADARRAVAPLVVVVRLSEPADPVGDGIEVSGPDGRDVARGKVVVSGATLTRRIEPGGQGSYLVEWRAVGDDGHPAQGSFLFSVGEPTRSSLPEQVRGGPAVAALGRWLSLTGFALGFGVVFAALLSGGMTAALWRIVNGGVVLMLIAEPIALAGQIATLAPARLVDPGFAENVLLTRYGHLAALRLGAALGLWALAGALRSASARAQWVIPAAALPVCLVFAGSAHRVVGLPSLASTLLAAGHVAAFAAWLGCIVVALREARGGRLSRPAVLAALVLVMTGSGLALGHLPSISALFDTAYGVTLAIKIALVALAFALGAAARRRAELAAALAVLAAASVLVSLLPPS